MASLSQGLRSSSTSSSIPLFLAPAFVRPSPLFSSHQTATFSTTPSQSVASAVRKQAKLKAKTSGRPNWALKARPKIDANKQRGVSAIRSTGPRSMRGLWKYPLPVPVARDYKGTMPEYEDAQDHGLWGFFDEGRNAMLDPDVESNHGRAWEYKELSWKSFDELHKLYWVCVKEHNRCLTREKERTRLRAGYGVQESEDRTETVRTTMDLIRQVLVDRQLAYNHAQKLVLQKSIWELVPNTAADPLEGEIVTGHEDGGGGFEADGPTGSTQTPSVAR